MGQLTLLPNISSLGFELAENKPLLFSIIFNRRTCYTIVYGGLSVWVTCPAVLRLQGPALKESSSFKKYNLFAYWLKKRTYNAQI